MSSSATVNPTRKTPESFLGPNAALVNLDSLVTKPAQAAPVINPFLASGGEAKSKYVEVVLKTFFLLPLFSITLYVT